MSPEVIVFLLSSHRWVKVHANSQRCKVDNDCQYQNQGQRCMNHTCLYICQSDDNCPLSGVCKTNVCNWNGSKVPILPSKINNGTTGTNSTSSVAVGDVVLDRTSVQGDNTTSTNTSSSITPTLSVNNTKDNDDNGGDKKFFSNELTKSIAVIMLGVLIVGLAITALCCVRRVSTKKYGEKSGQDYNDDNTYHNRNIVTPDVMTNIHDENDSPYQFIEQHKHRQQSSLHQKQPHPHMRESSFEEAHLHATGGDLDSEEISPLPLQPQLTFTEQTLYGSHGASTSSVDLKSTSQYPYLSQHHFMSSE
ncbi:1890_t:CDS:2 [Ambispora leptoticha]|uniref:1890_t:CDS:1 n=1 Tax=Ambispora leptoticha TaxID=144679 RepID=A0A9N9F108_9GLOM|nr:1890_t:CDS:2 [Ambispora leptoticha]